MWWLFQPHSCKNLFARKIMFMIASDMDFYVLFCSLIHCVPFCFKKFRDKQREKKIDCANNKIKNEKTRSTRPNRYNRTWTNKKNIISFNLLVILWATLFVPFCFNSLTRTHAYTRASTQTHSETTHVLTHCTWWNQPIYIHTKILCALFTLIVYSQIVFIK